MKNDHRATPRAPVTMQRLKDPRSELARQAFDIYEESFPPYEREPIEDLKAEFRNQERGDGGWFRFLIALQDEQVVGISVYTYHPEERLGYLWYMAIQKDFRGQEIGAGVLSQTVSDLTRTVRKRKMPEPLALCWEVERPSDADEKNEEDRKAREGRIRFYEKNGAHLIEHSALHAPPVAPGMREVIYHLMYLPLGRPPAPLSPGLARSMFDLILLHCYQVDRQSTYYRRSCAVRICRLDEVEGHLRRHLSGSLEKLSGRPTYGVKVETTDASPYTTVEGREVQALVAYESYGAPEDARLVGAILYRYFPLSSWGMVIGFFLAADLRGTEATHPASEPHEEVDERFDERFDEQYIAGVLKQKAVDDMRGQAGQDRKELTALFGEAVDFRAVHGSDRREAAHILENRRAVGARWLGLKEGETTLGAFSRSEPGRLLLIYPLNALNPYSIERDTLVDFLNVYSAYHGVGRAHVSAMTTKLNQVCQAYFDEYGEEGLYPFRELPELIRPILQIEKVAMCLHLITAEVDEAEAFESKSFSELVESEAGLWKEAAKRGEAARLIQRQGFEGPPQQPEAGQGEAAGLGRVQQPEEQPERKGVGLSILRSPKEFTCPVFHSFEIDILSYRFQDQPPLASVCEWEEQQHICIEFPRVIEYVSEGRQYAKYFLPDAAEGGAEDAQNTGAPPPNILEARVSLSYSRFPRTGIRIWHLTLMPRHGGAFSEFDLIRLVGLYYSEQEGTALLENTRFWRGNRDSAALKRPFKEFLYGLSGEKILVDRPTGGTIEWIPPEGDASVPWVEILSGLYEASEDDQGAFRRLEDLYRRYEGALDACCGVVTGHFDYAQMSFAEMQDTLTPSSSAGTYAVWLHRSILTNIDLQDEMLDRLRSSIGISPYLILPHAVLLHNECVVDLADRVAYHHGSPLKSLVEARRMIERVLRRQYIPNVFHYELERELYEIGGRSRGSLEKKQGVEVKLADLNSLIRDKVEERSRWSDLAITFFLGLLGLGSVLNFVDFFTEDDALKLRRGFVSLAIVLVIYAAILVSVFMGNRRIKSEGEAFLEGKTP